MYGVDENIGLTKEAEDGTVLVGNCMKTSVGNKYYYVFLQFEIGSDGILRVYQSGLGSGRSGYSATKEIQLQITVC